jgi:hypothetical protein
MREEAQRGFKTGVANTEFRARCLHDYVRLSPDDRNGYIRDSQASVYSSKMNRNKRKFDLKHAGAGDQHKSNTRNNMLAICDAYDATSTQRIRLGTNKQLLNAWLSSDPSIVAAIPSFGDVSQVAG